MLRARFVVCFVLVEIVTQRVYHRFLDEAFGVELAKFLASTRNYRTITPAQCASESAFDLNLASGSPR